MTNPGSTMSTNTHVSLTISEEKNNARSREAEKISDAYKVEISMGKIKEYKKRIKPTYSADALK